MLLYELATIVLQVQVDKKLSSVVTMVSLMALDCWSRREMTVSQMDGALKISSLAVQLLSWRLSL